MMSNELKASIVAAKDAGNLLIKNYGMIKVNYKPDGSIFTEVDIKAENRIMSFLEKKFPNYSLMGEETGYNDKGSDYLWVIDPLDGTTNYTIKNPFFSVSIALIYKNEPIIGTVYYPLQQELFYSEKGLGSYLNNKKITVSDKTEIKKSVITFCNSRKINSVETIIKIFGTLKTVNNKFRQIGAASLELCYVACGRTESFLMTGVNLWDVVAGVLMIKEAGGRVSDFKGLEFSHNSKNLLASNERLYKKMLNLIHLALN